MQEQNKLADYTSQLNCFSLKSFNIWWKQQTERENSIFREILLLSIVFYYFAVISKRRSLYLLEW